MNPSRKIVKRAVQRKATLPTDVYVSRQSSLVALLKRCERLFKSGDDAHFTIHGLGAAVSKAVSVALAFRERHSDVAAVDITTSTVNLVDTVLDDSDEDNDEATNQRKNSAVHIRIHKVKVKE
ncbi:hypothetical protein BC830DRAFT_1172823 [Chytriomyces sp. MP71]|nr:hypothetical protein BC830DRAFT_1172823 [Chytriomyces sp. MP71]